MAGNRIRYKDHNTRENCLLTINAYVSKKTGARYRIVLDLNEMQFHIRNERSKEFVFSSKQYGNMNVLKRNARSKLESFGVDLSRESRDRTFGLCDKGHTQYKEERNN